MASQEVHFTGERVIPGEVNQDLWNEHYARYRFAATFVAGKQVLDVGCGTGYGTALLAEFAAGATGFDVSVDAVEYAKEHYAKKATFVAADALDFPAEDESFQVVTAFEVIEHITDYQRLVGEAARVLIADGVFLVSTPNKIYYSETRREAGPNPYHVHEFELDEFRAVLLRSFPHVQVVAQNQQEAVVFGGESSGGGTSYLASQPALHTAQFFIALCSKRPITPVPFIYVAEAGNLLREREHHIHLLQDELARAQADHLHLMAEHEHTGRELEISNDWARGLDQQLEAKSSELANIVALLDEANGELIKRTEWAHEQESLCDERTRWAKDLDQVVHSQAEKIRELSETVEERTAWAVRLDEELATARALIEERTTWALQADAELAHHSNNGHMLQTDESRSTPAKELETENQRLKEQISYCIQVFEESQGQLAEVGQIADRLSHERELVRISKWLKLGRLLHLGPRLAEDNPPV